VSITSSSSELIRSASAGISGLYNIMPRSGRLSIAKAEYLNAKSQSRHCEEPLRRSNLASLWLYGLLRIIGRACAGRWLAMTARGVPRDRLKKIAGPTIILSVPSRSIRLSPGESLMGDHE
jgi:hypothetical protein